MSRYGLIGMFGLLFLASAAVGCGDDDGEQPNDGGTGGPATGKALEDLTASEKEALCEDLLEVVRGTSTPERQCIEYGLADSTSESACDRARMECLDDELYQDFDAYRCLKFTASTAPDFDCTTKVSEVRSCYASVSNWLKGLRCSQAGDAPALPECIDDLEQDCDFGLSDLVETPEVDAGAMMCDPDDFELGAECNACAAENCCGSFAACQDDTDCKCYWDCLGRGDEEETCYGVCDITTDPEAFVDQAVCLVDNCTDPCNLRAP